MFEIGAVYLTTVAAFNQRDVSSLSHLKSVVRTSVLLRSSSVAQLTLKTSQGAVGGLCTQIGYRQIVLASLYTDMS